MSSHDIDFVTFHLAAERDLGLPLHDAFAQLGCHLLGIIRIEIKLLSDLFIREIQPHEVEAEDPDAQRLVMTGEDGPGQVIKPSVASGAFIPLARRLSVITSLLDHLGGRTMGTSHSVGPAE
jgi:hypothetical protein